jgi:hypothetical protein
MPVHDWTRVDDGVFHDFHLGWIAEFRRVLNGGLLPEGYFALAEQVAGGGNPDVLTLRDEPPKGTPAFPPEEGGVGLLTSPPKTRLVVKAERENYTAKQRRMVIRHSSDERIVAMIEVVSAGNKGSRHAFQTMLDKLLAALSKGIHLLVLDLHPPTPRDPNGVHGSLWGQLDGSAFELPPDADRTLVAYSAGLVKEAFVEPVAVGQTLSPMPLFLTPDGVGYVNVPLEATYQAAYAAVPQRYRRILEARPPA